jgi:hypothetical protein
MMLEQIPAAHSGTLVQPPPSLTNPAQTRFTQAPTANVRVCCFRPSDPSRTAQGNGTPEQMSRAVDGGCGCGCGLLGGLRLATQSGRAPGYPDRGEPKAGR